jgi:hypothetical protein
VDGALWMSASEALMFSWSEAYFVTDANHETSLCISESPLPNKQTYIRCFMIKQGLRAQTVSFFCGESTPGNQFKTRSWLAMDIAIDPILLGEMNNHVPIK